jgi:hypothetical protein
MTHPTDSSEELREAFEEWRLPHPRDVRDTYVLEKTPDGGYYHDMTDFKWEGWKAAMSRLRASLPHPTAGSTEGCGCVYCDLGLDPDVEVEGVKFHHAARRGNILCERKREPEPMDAFKRRSVPLPAFTEEEKAHLAILVPSTPAQSELVEAAERVNKLAVQKAQMTAREHGNALYRDFMQDADRKLDEAFQAHYEALSRVPSRTPPHEP